ncbi:MAG: acyltransferase [archaeon]
MKACKIYGKVQLGKDTIADDYTVIGYPATDDGTRIGEKGLIRSHTVIYSGNRIGSCFQTGHHVNIRECNEIGDNVSIGTGSVVEHHVKIEDNVRIHSNAFICEFTVLRKGCWIGPGVIMTNAKYPASVRSKENLTAPEIGEGAIIGGNASVLPGVRIGRNALIGAGSVVTKDIPENAVASGNPAKVINTRDMLRYPDGSRAYEGER